MINYRQDRNVMNMKQLKQILVKTSQKTDFFEGKKDFDRFLGFVDLYRKSLHVSLLFYGYEGNEMMLLLATDGNEEQFVKRVMEAYKYDGKNTLFYRFKIILISMKSELLSCLNYMNSLENNATEHLKNTSRYDTNGAISGNELLNMFRSWYTKNQLLTEIAKEPTAQYCMRMNQIVKADIGKKDKRKKRAMIFLEKYLESKGMSLLEAKRNRQELHELVDAFRENTDLSYRDIGSVLGLSHTSVRRAHFDLLLK